MRDFESYVEEMSEQGVLEQYLEMCEAGQSPNMAAMLASQKAPGLKGTDTQFLRDENYNMRRIDEDQMNRIQQIAKRAGINTQGKVYNGQLGKYTDPYAWVSDLSDVKRTAEHKEMDIEGAVKVNAYRGPKKKTRIAPDILNRLERQARKSNKSLDTKCRNVAGARQELRQRLTDKHTRPKD